jgi:hypothetical protein
MPGEVTSAAPTLGADNHKVFLDPLGLTGQECAAYEAIASAFA